MTFPQKSAVTTIAALLVAYGGYAAVLAAEVSDRDVREFAYKPMMVVATIVLAVIMAVGHGVLAARTPRDAGTLDERDRWFALRASRLGGLVLAVGVFGSLVLAMAEAASFYVANALLLSWVLAEVANRATLLVLYGRGGE